MSEIHPFELLQEFVDQLGYSNEPLLVCNNPYRPIVFQVNTTKHFVFCLIPLEKEPRDFFETVTPAYDKYLDGKSTDGYIFFRNVDPSVLKSEVIAWYRGLQN